MEAPFFSKQKFVLELCVRCVIIENKDAIQFNLLHIFGSSGLGNMNLYEGVYEDGVLFGVWDGGPWTAFKYAQNPAMSWLSGGTHHFDLMV